MSRLLGQLAMAALLICVVCGCDGPVIEIDEAGLTILENEEGAGEAARKGDTVTISYRAALPDGKVVLRDDEFSFILGRGAVIRGLDEGVLGMKAGGRRVIDCPPHRHWGRGGYGDGAIPPNTNLHITVQLLDITAPRRLTSG